MSSVRLSVEDVLHQLEIQEGFEDEYCTNLNEESSDDDTQEVILLRAMGNKC